MEPCTALSKRIYNILGGINIDIRGVINDRFPAREETLKWLPLTVELTLR
jgi:hypothetical protein